MAERFEVVEGAIRQTHVAVEGLCGDIQLLAKGILGMEEKAQSFHNETIFHIIRERFGKKPADVPTRP